MMYFRVPDSLDQKRIFNNGKYKGFLIGKELYTEREADRLHPALKYQLEQVDLKKSKTYWFFGARFAMGE